MPTPTAAFAHPPVYSPWFTFATQAPWEPGVYAVLTGGGESRFSYWGGECWHCTAPTVAEAHEMSSHPTLLQRLVPTTATAFWMAAALWLGFLLARAEGWL